MHIDKNAIYSGQQKLVTVLEFSQYNRSEYRLYFQTNIVMNMAREGSTLVFGIDSDNQFWAELIL